ncbi:uncharacterized protein LOC119665568 [Teleopsis dalmanni]|uniref:uncharacterized protein LOC119665568 n=1 Tax=Teleopsis dalmanni TaxID=139649 RepID=UPI0018CFDF79|nr:uncharacterized protein LOC119665568 [Teleopsis dalmanni]
MGQLNHVNAFDECEAYFCGHVPLQLKQAARNWKKREQNPKNREGDILIQLTKETGTLTKDFCTEMRNTFQDYASVKSLTQHTLIECMDLDEVTSNEKVCAAIADQFPAMKISNINVKFWRSARDDTRPAIIEIPTKNGSVLIIAALVRVDWVRSRIRKHVAPMWCFKCLQFGHSARQCKSDNNRSSTCMRCEEDGHRAKNELG